MRPTLAATLLVLAGGTLPTGAADFVVSKATLATESELETAMEKSTALTTGFGPVTYVDWTIPYNLETEQCEDPQSGSFAFSAYGDYHALVDVTPGDPAAFPLNDISCEGPERLRIRGLYYVLVSAIPEANTYEFRPLPVTLETIAQLKAAGAL